MASSYDSHRGMSAARMVAIEFEAAEALAGLAHSAMREKENGSRGAVIEEERPSQRVNNESPVGDSNQVVIVQQKCGTICRVMMKGMKVEQDAELSKPHPMCTTSYAGFSCSKSRPTLTEAEKEARSIHRVLANRESARQTIQRRKVMYEELTGKAASLTRENENLKREKKWAVKEYESLKSTNQCLKAQMAMTMRAEVEETRVDSKLTNAETSTSLPTNYPFLLHNQPPFTPFLSAPIIRSSNPLPAIATPVLFHKEENPREINCPGTPFYILPFPWFFPLPDSGTGSNLRPFFDLNNEPNATAVNNQCGASSSSKTTAHLEKHHPLSRIKVKRETECERNVRPSEKQTGGNAAAAEARKRRKELTKLKSLNCR